MATGREIIEARLFLAGRIEPVHGAGFVLQPAHDLDFAMRLQVGGAGAVHRGAGGKHPAFGRVFDGGFIPIRHQILGLDGCAEALTSSGKQLALERGGTGLGGGVLLLGGNVGVDGRTERFTGPKFLMRAKHDDRPERKAESFHGSRDLRFWKVCARDMCSETDWRRNCLSGSCKSTAWSSAALAPLV